MQQTANSFQVFRFIGVILLTSVLMFSCENKEKKTTEVQATEKTTDTLPALDKPDSSGTRPETIKN